MITVGAGERPSPPAAEPGPLAYCRNDTSAASSASGMAHARAHCRVHAAVMDRLIDQQRLVYLSFVVVLFVFVCVCVDALAFRFVCVRCTGGVSRARRTHERVSVMPKRVEMCPLRGHVVQSDHVSGRSDLRVRVVCGFINCTHTLSQTPNPPQNRVR